MVCRKEFLKSLLIPLFPWRFIAMLILSRKKAQFIRLDLGNGDLVTIHVCETRSRVVRLGVEAPEYVNITRGELPRDHQNKKSRAGVAP